MDEEMDKRLEALLEIKPEDRNKSIADMRRTLKKGLGKIRWKQPGRGGVLTDALGGAIFVFIAGAGWLMIESAAHTHAPATRAAAAAAVDLAAR